VQLHRRTTGRWSHAGRERAIGNDGRAMSGDTSDLVSGCRDGALRADFTLATPPEPSCHGMATMGVRAAMREIRDSLRGGEDFTRERRFGHGQHSRAGIDHLGVDRFGAAVSIAVQRTPPLVDQAGDGRPSTRAEQKVLNNPRGVSQTDANTFYSLARQARSARIALGSHLLRRRLGTKGVSPRSSSARRRAIRRSQVFVRSASVAMIAKTCSPYLSALVRPRPCTLIRSGMLWGRASAMAMSVASVKTQYAGSF
jgi:hypothetical protein